jgi:predicted RNase H-like HicB family nuclease
VLHYHAAYYLPNGADKMVVAEVLDFPGVLSQGFDLSDARQMIADALTDIAQLHLEEGRPLPPPNPEAASPEADLIELLPLTVEVSASKL